jgi:hypothetical protein
VSGERLIPLQMGDVSIENFGPWVNPGNFWLAAGMFASRQKKRGSMMAGHANAMHDRRYL